MGKYVKKHVWKPCEFIYTIRHNGKNAGDMCGTLSKGRHDGKYFCWMHNPKRMLIVKRENVKKGIKNIMKQEARLQARKEAYKLIRNGAPTDAILQGCI